MRVADVFRIDGSGISRDDYSFALSYHFDFTMVDRVYEPLFAVEFDGPGHGGRRPDQRRRQRENDHRKNRLCDHFEFPIVRITSEHITTQYRGLDVLTYFAELWFEMPALMEAHSRGHPAIECDPSLYPRFVVRAPNRKGLLPYSLSCDLGLRLSNLYQEGRISSVPMSLLGWDSEGGWHCLSYLALDKDSYIISENTVYARRFPIHISDIMYQISTIEVYEGLKRVFRGEEDAEPLGVLREIKNFFYRKYEIFGNIY